MLRTYYVIFVMTAPPVFPENVRGATLVTHASAIKTKMVLVRMVQIMTKPGKSCAFVLVSVSRVIKGTECDVYIT